MLFRIHKKITIDLIQVMEINILRDIGKYGIIICREIIFMQGINVNKEIFNALPLA